MWKRSNISFSALVIISLSNLFLLSVAAPTTENCKEKLIIDADVGGDDAIAILLMLEAQKHMKQCLYEIVAITCSYGNTEEEQVEENVRKTLTIAGRIDIPVYAGAKKPLLWKHIKKASHVFGEDGLGDTTFDETIQGTIDKSKHASQAMIELSKTYSGNLNILVLGPTTNIALAGALDNDFFGRLKHLYVMGASVAGVGNVRPGIEFNFGSDPQANQILLSSTDSSKFTLFPWETAVNSGYNNEWRKSAFTEQEKKNSKIIRFLDNTENIALTVPTYQPVDVYTAAAMLLGNKFIKKSLECNVAAVVDGLASGGVLVDYKSEISSKNARIIQQVDIEMYKKLYVCAFTGNNCEDF